MSSPPHTSSSSSSSSDSDTDAIDLKELVFTSDHEHANEDNPELQQQPQPRKMVAEEETGQSKDLVIGFQQAKQSASMAMSGGTTDEKEIREHLLLVHEVVKLHGTSCNETNPETSKGLSKEEASMRLARYGRNALSPPKSTPLWLLFVKEFTGVFPIMLELAGLGCVINFVINDKSENLFLGIALWLVVTISAILNFIQVRKSVKAMKGFNSMTATSTVVIRDGEQLSVPSDCIVVGDVVRLKVGDKVPADIRVIYCSQLKVDNSSMTGESEPQSRSVQTKEQNPFEATNLLFMGTLVVSGEGYGIVIRTGDNTLLARTAKLAMVVKNEPTILQREIQVFVKRLSFIGILVGIIVLVTSVATGDYWLDSIVYGVGSVVAIVPEGLQLTVTIALALTAQRMGKQNVLVKKLSIVETLGSTSVICSDKTGTLTQNKMVVSHVVYDMAIFNCEKLKHTANHYNEDDPGMRALVQCAALCNRATFDASDTTSSVHNRKVIGDASETALLRFVSNGLLDVSQARSRFRKKVEIPFNSINKWQLSIHQDMGPGKRTENTDTLDMQSDTNNNTSNDEGNQGQFLLMKGAPERIVKRCATMLLDGEEVPVNEEREATLNSIISELGFLGERVMGFARLPLSPTDYPPDYQFDEAAMNFPTDKLCFIGFVSIYDPPRERVDEAVKTCNEAGIKVVMVTGDHPATAAAIARQIGIIKDPTPEELVKQGVMTAEEATLHSKAMVVVGTELDSFDDNMWDIVTSKKQLVFARTSPEQKLQIVTHFQQKGEIVAVTGDGVNDSPALKQSDVGVAMGIAGSEVAKEAADIILMDDNFATIIKAVEEGRLVFDNLKKAIAYGLSAKLPEILPFLSFIILGLPLPLSTVLVLCIDIGTDLIPGIALVYEKAETNIMKKKPRNPKKHKLVSLKLIFFSFVQIGILQATSGFLSYFITMNAHGFPPSSLPNTSRDYFMEGAKDLIVDGKAMSWQKQMDALAAAQTSFFVSIIITQLADCLICKTRFLSLFQQHSRNYLQAFGMLVAITIAIIFTYVPALHDVLKTSSLDWVDWICTLPFSIFIIIQDEIRKLLIRRNPNGKVAKYTFW